MQHTKLRLISVVLEENQKNYDNTRNNNRSFEVAVLRDKGFFLYVKQP